MATRNARFPRLIGVIHLPPLAGSPRVTGYEPEAVLSHAGRWAVEEARLLAKAGFEALVIENFGDAPFYKDRVPPETIASMSVIAAAVREASGIPVGVNILRNDADSALAVAAVTGCEFIRVNVLTGIAATDQGMVEGRAATLLRERSRLGASVRIFADVHVKHAKSLHSDDVALAVEEAAGRGLADAVIVTGATTGRAADPLTLERAWEAARFAGVPLYLGSGSTAEDLPELLRRVDGVIVGSAIRKGGKAGEPLDPKRVAEFAKVFKAAVQSGAGAARPKAARKGVSAPKTAPSRSPRKSVARTAGKSARRDATASRTAVRRPRKSGGGKAKRRR